MSVPVRTVRSPEPQDVEDAWLTVREALAPTPVVPSALAPGALLKLESFQPTGAFKVRGALTALARLPAGATAVTASSGNHGLAMAYAASRTAADVTVVVAETASPAKVANSSHTRSPPSSTASSPPRRPLASRTCSASGSSPGAHVTAVGADMDGKRELAASVLTAAGLIAADDVAQRRRVGELRYATEGVMDGAVAVGDVLAGQVPGRTSDDQITVADLTGLGAKDAAVGTVVAQASTAAIRQHGA